MQTIIRTLFIKPKRFKGAKIKQGSQDIKIIMCQCAESNIQCSEEGPGTWALISALDLEMVVCWLFALMQSLYCRRIPAKAKSILRGNSRVGLPAALNFWVL